VIEATVIETAAFSNGNTSLGQHQAPGVARGRVISYIFFCNLNVAFMFFYLILFLL